MRVSADGLPIDAGRALQVGDAARAAGSGRAKAQIRVGPVAARQMTQLVAMLWNAAPRTRTAAGNLSDSRSSIGTTTICERARSAVIAEQKPRKINNGDVFLVGDFEAMLVAF